MQSSSNTVCSALVCSQPNAPALQAVRESPPWAVDAWGLGCLMQELYSGQPLARMEDLRNTEPVPKELLQYYQVGDAWAALPVCMHGAVRCDQACTPKLTCCSWMSWTMGNCQQ